MCVNQQPDKTDAQHEFNSSGHYLAYDSKHESEWRWGLQHALEREGSVVEPSQKRMRVPSVVGWWAQLECARLRCTSFFSAETVEPITTVTHDVNRTSRKKLFDLPHLVERGMCVGV
jgi:hypothetical protein